MPSTKSTGSRVRIRSLQEQQKQAKRARNNRLAKKIGRAILEEIRKQNQRAKEEKEKKNKKK